jgi:F-type H+-transporting ATPase subunit gamma
MKALSAANVRKGGVVLENTRLCRDFIDTAAAVAPSLPGVTIKKAGPNKMLVAFGSQYGLCGAFNERVLEAVYDAEAKLGCVAWVVLMGKRLAERAPDQICCKPVLKIDAPGSVDGIDDAIGDLLTVIYDKYRCGEFDEIYFIYPSFAAEMLSMKLKLVLPPSFESTGEEPPMMYLPPQELLEGLLREHLSIHLYATILETLIAENESRMRSMDFASKNIQKKIDEATQSFNYALQEEVTGELLEIIGGYEAIRKGAEGV